jgi:enoyl-[acyl-carrier protein] reductase I
MSEATQTAPALAGLLSGKKGLIVGVANQNSIAWGCAKALHGAGMELAFTYQGETMRERVTRTVREVGDVPLFDLDVRSDEQIASVVDAVRERWGSLDFLLHSVAFAPKAAMANPFLETTREDFLAAHEISAYSLVGLSRAFAPLMPESGGSIVTMTYYGAQKAVPGYNVMGVAKAALEASVRYLAVDMGGKRIRVNAISAGPVKTLAASGIGDFRYILKWNEYNAPLKRNTTLDDVGGAAVYLLSELGGGTTGEVLHVDSGYHVVGMKAVDAPDISVVKD